MAKKKPGVPFANAQTHSEALLEQYLDSPEVREKRARAALEAYLKRDNPEPKESPLTPTEQKLRDFYADPKRREDKAKRALEAAQKRDAAANDPAKQPTPSEKALEQFNSDPARREEKARKDLEAAQKRDREDRARAAAPKPRRAVAATIDDAGKGIGSVLGKIGGKFLAVAGPLTVLETVLSSATSGFQTVTKSVNLLASVIAPVLLPATVLLSTALVAISDVAAGLLPGLEGFFTVMIGLGVPILVAFIEMLSSATDRLKEWSDRLTPEKGSTAEQVLNNADPVRFVQRNILNAVYPQLGTSVETVSDARNGGARNLSRPTGSDAERTVMASLRDVMASLRQSIGPKAQISGLGGIGQAVQLAALNRDPIEARMLRVQQQILTSLERAVRRVENSRRVYDPSTGEGDYSGDTGSGGGGDYGGGDF